MALILFCFITARSLRSSFSDTHLPLTELNSWRLTPLNTIRFPFSIMMFSFISNLRNPAFCGITSHRLPSESNTSIVRSYSFGSSALHSSGFFTSQVHVFSPSSSFSSSKQISPLYPRRIRAFPLPHVTVRISSSPFSKVSSGTARILISCILLLKITAAVCAITKYSLYPHVSHYMSLL